MLRYEIERDLIEGRMEASDLPERWDQLMQAYLGLGTKGNYRDGCLQDIHWTDGSFGYFPSYTLGAIYAAQQAEAMQQQQGSLEQLIGNDLSSVFEWLQQNIWQHASLLDTDFYFTETTKSILFKAYISATGSSVRILLATLPTLKPCTKIENITTA